MKESEVVDYARPLYEAHGDKAEAEAAQKQAEAKSQAGATEAEDWARCQI